MEISEEMRYRLSYLVLRLICDAKLERDWGKTDLAGVLQLVDLMSGSQLASESEKLDADRKYMSQRTKLEDFIDAEFGEEVLAIVTRAVANFV